jgi:epoxyqueuosine reductase
MIIMHGQDTFEARRAAHLKDDIRRWGRELGFDAIGFAGVDLGSAGLGLADWLAAGCHGEMDYMAAHRSEAGYKRAEPEELLPGTRCIITARLNYRVASADSRSVLGDSERAFVSRYALGRDYHKLLRQRLQKLVERIEQAIGPYAARVFTDSAPVMEVELAAEQRPRLARQAHPAART